MQKRTAAEQVDYLEQLETKYPSLQFVIRRYVLKRLGWLETTERIGQPRTLVGDDLFVTNTEILAKRYSKRNW